MCTTRGAVCGNRGCGKRGCAEVPPSLCGAVCSGRRIVFSNAEYGHTCALTYLVSIPHTPYPPIAREGNRSRSESHKHRQDGNCDAAPRYIPSIFHKPTLRDLLSICDLQEKFRGPIHEFQKVVDTTKKLLKASQILDIPVFATTQLRSKLGETCPELGLDAPDGVQTKAHADKSAFSMFVPEVQQAFHALGPEKKEVVIVGIETHICVTQTTLDLLREGHKVYVIADAVSSCNPQEIGIALARLRAEGAVVTSSESFLYECMGDAGIAEFKGVAGVVKEYSAKTRESLQALYAPGGTCKLTGPAGPVRSGCPESGSGRKGASHATVSANAVCRGREAIGVQMAQTSIKAASQSGRQHPEFDSRLCGWGERFLPLCSREKADPLGPTQAYHHRRSLVYQRQGPCLPSSLTARTGRHLRCNHALPRTRLRVPPSPPLATRHTRFAWSGTHSSSAVIIGHFWWVPTEREDLVFVTKSHAPHASRKAFTVDSNGKLGVSAAHETVLMTQQQRRPLTMASTAAERFGQQHPPRPALESQHSSSVPSTPFQRPRDMRFHSRSPSPHRAHASQSPASVVSESIGDHRPAQRAQSGPVVCKFETGAEIRKRRMPYLADGHLELPPPSKEPKMVLDPDEDEKLSGDMRELYDRLLPSDESEARRAKLIKKLERILNEGWPGNDIRVNVFGSSGNLLASSDSDVDICITTSYKKMESMHDLASLLSKSMFRLYAHKAASISLLTGLIDGMEKVECRASAKVPIVKIWDPELRLACDMNINNPMALENTRMIKTYVQIDPRVRPLAKIIKYWTKRRILNDAGKSASYIAEDWD
nr:poly(a) rna polymerase cid13 [Quercus suber]